MLGREILFEIDVRRCPSSFSRRSGGMSQKRQAPLWLAGLLRRIEELTVSIVMQDSNEGRLSCRLK